MHVFFAVISAGFSEMVARGSGQYIFTGYFVFVLYISIKSWYTFIDGYRSDPETALKLMEENWPKYQKRK